MRRIISFVRSWFIFSSVFRRLEKLERDRKKHIRHLASRMNELQRILDKINDLEEKVTQDAIANESVIRTYEESLDIERGKLRIAEEMISNQVLRNKKFQEQYKEDIAASVQKQVALIPPERSEL